MEDDKKYRKKMTEVEEKATEALACVGSDFDRLKATDITYLLRWYQVPRNELGGKDANYNTWLDIYGVDPPTYLKWTDVDEAQLVEHKKREINISDTALGHQQETNRRELDASVHLYMDKQLSSLKKKIAEARDMNVDHILPV